MEVLPCAVGTLPVTIVPLRGPVRPEPMSRSSSRFDSNPPATVDTTH